MNNTKWNELRLAMYGIEPPPMWSTLLANGFRSPPDREWFYHFREGGYDDIVYVDIFANDPDHHKKILAAIKTIHVPGSETDFGFKVVGYVKIGEFVDYI